MSCETREKDVSFALTAKGVPPVLMVARGKAVAQDGSGIGWFQAFISQHGG